MPRRIHVLFLMEDLCYGGTQRQTLQLAARLDRESFRVSMLTLTGETDLDNEARAAGIELSHIGSTRAVAPLFFLTLPRYLRALAPDVVVPCTALPNIWGRIWCRLLPGGPRVVATVRGGGAPARQHERFLWRLGHHVICNSEALYAIMRGFGVPQSGIDYIPNGVNTDLFAPGDTPPSARKPRITCVARLCEDKDHETLIRAFEIVHGTHPDALLRLVGDGPWEERVLARIAASPARASIERFPGTPDVREHYAASRIFALSSVREGQPNVLIEAMACGLPVCATAVGGIPRLVEEGANGYLSRSSDPAALAASLARLLDSPQLCDEMGRRNRARAVEKFSFAPMVAAHERIFRRLVNA